MNNNSLNFRQLFANLHILRIDLSENQIKDFLFNQSVFEVDVVDLSDNPLKSFELIPDPQLVSSTVFKFDATIFPEFDIHTHYLHKDDNYTFLMESMMQKTMWPTFKINDCGCGFEKLVNLNENFNQLNFEFMKMVCGTPDRLKGRLMKTITAEEILCDDGCQNFDDCQCSTREFDQSVLLSCTKFDINNFTLLDSSSQPLSSKYNNLRLVFNNQSELPVIPKNFKFKVTEIVAPGNKIQNVLIENLASDHLKILDLRYNQISTLNKEVAEKLKGIEKVSLGGNPWICDCSIFQLFNYLHTHTQLTEHQRISCKNLGKSLVEVKVNDVCFDWTFGIAALCSDLLWRY